MCRLGFCRNKTIRYDVRASFHRQPHNPHNVVIIRHVVLPHALPGILSGIRIGLGVGWSTLVAAELVAAIRVLGFMVQSASQYLATDIVLVGILAIALELGLRALQRHLMPWSVKGD
jgi:taurine transport system permease protein